MTSRPFMMGLMARCWIAEGCSKPETKINCISVPLPCVQVVAIIETHTVRVYTANEIFAEIHSIERGKHIDIFTGLELDMRQIVGQQTRFTAAHYVNFNSITVSLDDCQKSINH